MMVGGFHFFSWIYRMVGWWDPCQGLPKSYATFKLSTPGTGGKC